MIGFEDRSYTSFIRIEEKYAENRQKLSYRFLVGNTGNSTS